MNIDCGSYTPAGVNQVADAVVEQLERLGATVERAGGGVAPNGRPLGDLVVGRIPGSGPRLLLIGHMDTVFEPGTAARPFQVEGDRGMGPGVSDMKGGLLAGLAALSALAELGHRPAVTFVANPDEGDRVAGLRPCHPLARHGPRRRARPRMRPGQRRHRECPKGIAEMAVTIHGRAAHAGIEPEKGRSAILAAARMVEALHALNEALATVTCNVGVISGGRDRMSSPDLPAGSDPCGQRLEFAEAEEAVDRIAAEPALADTVAEHHVMASHQPMEKSPASARLVELAQAVAAEIGFTVGDTVTGGASDANTTSAAGLHLDGLGPIGGDDHAPPEWSTCPASFRGRPCSPD